MKSNLVQIVLGKSPFRIFPMFFVFWPLFEMESNWMKKVLGFQSVSASKMSATASGCMRQWIATETLDQIQEGIVHGWSPFKSVSANTTHHPREWPRSLICLDIFIFHNRTSNPKMEPKSEGIVLECSLSNDLHIPRSPSKMAFLASDWLSIFYL